MKLLQYIVEIDHAYLTWQAPEQSGASRVRRVVAEIRTSKLGAALFRYLTNTDDYRAAIETGFKGYPAFRLEKTEHVDGVLEAFLRRLPPRNREDFKEYLTLHRLPHPFPASDLTLLSYTGAKLPSDGFSLNPDFTKVNPPIDYLLEVAGFRYTDANVDGLNIGDPVKFVWESDNPVDQDAVMITHAGSKIGYVNRAMRHSFLRWLQFYKVSGTVERINGKVDRPLVFVLVQVR